MIHHPQDRAERLRIKKLKSEKAKERASKIRHAIKEAIKDQESLDAIRAVDLEPDLGD